MPQNKKKNKQRNNSSERGNVFFFILIGVVLFASLSFTISRGFQSDTTNRLTGREATLAASDILTYTQQISRAIDRMRRRSVSENDISFNQDIVTGYNHTPVQPTENRVFNAQGGNVTFRAPQDGVNDGSDWIFNGSTCIPDVGRGSTGCQSDTTSNEELIAILPNISANVCEAINRQLNITGIPTDTGSGANTTPFTGTYGDGNVIILAGGPFETACYERSGNNVFYSVLIAR